jgi:hypothetical protein
MIFIAAIVIASIYEHRCHIMGSICNWDMIDKNLGQSAVMGGHGCNFVTIGDVHHGGDAHLDGLVPSSKVTLGVKAFLSSGVLDGIGQKLPFNHC